MVSTAVTDQQRATPRRGGRGLRRLVVVLLVLAGLLVGADFALAAFAEHTVSQKAREELGLTDDPSVVIHGFPFATQAISGDYDHITVSADSIPVADVLKDVGIRAELRDVTAPLSDLTSGNVGAIKIGDAEGQVKIKASDLAGVTPLNRLEDLRIEPSSESYVRHGEGSEENAGTDTDPGSGSEGDTDAGDNSGSGDSGSEGDTSEEDKEDSKAGIRLSGKVKIGGEETTLFAFAMIQLKGTSIQITPQRLQFGNDQDTTVVPREVQEALLPSFTADVNTGDLPFTVTPKTIEVSSGSVTVKGEAKHLTFSGVSQR